MEILYRMGALSSSEKRCTNYMIDERPLSGDWYQNMRKKTLVLWDLQSIHLPWKAAHENYDALKLYIQDHKKDLTVSSEIHLVSDKAQDAMMKLVQLVTNCVVSFTTFLTITEQYMKRKYEDSKPQLDKWNLKRNEIHKNTFSYRLGYELRNYSQHYGIPFSEIVFTMNPDSIEELQVYVKPEELLHGGFNWKKLRQELECKKDKEIELISLLFEYLGCVDCIYMNTLLCHCEELKDCQEFLDKLIKKYDIALDEYPVIFKGPTPPNAKVPREKEFIPLYLSNKMNKDWSTKLDFNVTSA
ncbi:hypothetical protein [Photobacterium leiognathi]|uniref:hypothetical protein n=1 Tax=Photobacterium leiognathi TaxID=553611 RepID=UPI0029819CF2|nr:hypothetical protein [Photobacterium leiognathi]